MTYWYLSFALDAARGGFRGATVVEARDEMSALATATMRGLNPGGEVAILEIMPDEVDDADVKAMLNRLVGREEMDAMGGRRHGDLPQNIQHAFEGDALFICEECNHPGDGCTCH